MALTAPETVTLTCPVCGNTEVAEGQGSCHSSHFKDCDGNDVLQTTLSYSASVQHDCPGITAPAP